MFKRPPFSSKLATACVFAASYLPPLVGLIYGVGHCDTCRQMWMKVVWIVQGAIIPLIFTNLFRLPRVDETWGIVLAIAVQIAWLVGWTWLGSRSKVWLVFTTIIVLGLSIWFTYVTNAVIRILI